MSSPIGPFRVFRIFGHAHVVDMSLWTVVKRFWRLNYEVVDGNGYQYHGCWGGSRFLVVTPLFAFEIARSSYDPVYNEFSSRLWLSFFPRLRKMSQNSVFPWRWVVFNRRWQSC